jgi:hypothetical protein
MKMNIVDIKILIVLVVVVVVVPMLKVVVGARAQTAEGEEGPHTVR